MINRSILEWFSVSGVLARYGIDLLGDATITARVKFALLENASTEGLEIE
jgi:hypothetical protein